jgi:predicted dehydrogenase
MKSSKLARRQFLSQTALGTAGLACGLRAHASANDEIRIAFLSCGGRANELMGSFSKVPGVKIVGLSDPDSTRVAKAKTRFPDAKTSTDLRKLIEDPDIDAVVVATCNHWHCLAAIWAMQAGKDVYVEKPLSHTQWEGEQTIAAARKYQRICQVGTQQRSDPMQKELKAFLHEQQALGQIQRVQVNRFGVRGPIGKRKDPLPKDPNVDYDLWLGPAADRPVFRNAWHYDWHWDWNTGSGEMGNWGVHVLDDVRNVVFRDSVRVPRRILGGGGRVVWDDAGQSPNVHAVAFDTGSIPVVIGLSNLPDAPDGKKSPDFPGPGSGYVVYCQAGRLEGQSFRYRWQADQGVQRQWRKRPPSQLHRRGQDPQVGTSQRRRSGRSRLDRMVQFCEHLLPGWRFEPYRGQSRIGEGFPRLAEAHRADGRPLERPSNRS